MQITCNGPSGPCPSGGGASLPPPAPQSCFLLTARRLGAPPPVPAVSTAGHFLIRAARATPGTAGTPQCRPHINRRADRRRAILLRAATRPHRRSCISRRRGSQQGPLFARGSRPPPESTMIVAPQVSENRHTATARRSIWFCLKIFFPSHPPFRYSVSSSWPPLPR